jgi:tetratricopeptide (TPR) repeat protein
MSKNLKKKDEFASVEQALSTSEAFIEKYQKQILIAVCAIVAIVLLALAARNFYFKPREVAAENEMYRAQVHFANGAFEQALNGDNFETIGFRAIATGFRMTSSGNLANAYAGISYYRLGDYENAIKFLSKFRGKDSYFSASVVGLIGDSYVQLGETQKAIGFFEKAANMKNDVMSPIYLKKAGLAYESLGQLDRAARSFQAIKDSYPRSQEAVDIEKYIARVTR